MPKKRKRQKAAPPPLRTSVSAQIAQPAGTSDYKHFSNSYLPYPKILTQRDIDKWKDSNALNAGDHPDKEHIINEVVKKFNNTNTLGIPNFSYEQKGPGSSTFYSVDNDGPRLDMVPKHHKVDGPNPLVIAHELMHANDHQSGLAQDHLTPKMWERLRTLATEGGAGGNAMNNFADFTHSIKQIQQRLDPDFADNMYAIDEPYIEGEISAADGLGGAANYNIPTTPANAPDWTPLFDNIRNVVTHTPPPPPPPAAGAPVVQNPQFYLNRASEFPAYMMENLTRPWDTANPKIDQQGNLVQNPLMRPEARTMYHMLKDVGDSYTAQDAPVMNQHIRDRRNSIFSAFNPAEFAAEQVAIAGGGAPAPRAAEWLSHGGRVTGKNLLSRFIKPKRKAS